MLSNRYFRLGLAATLIFLAGVCAGAGLLYYRYKLAISAAQIKRHNLSGEVFLQTTDGSVRRAAGATVYVFSDASQGRSLFTSLLAQVLALQLKKGISDRERVESLRATILQLSNAHVWYSTTCDSSGEFRINLPIGMYYLVTTGRAGYNEAVWLCPMRILDADEKVSLAEPALVYEDFPAKSR